MWSNNLFHRNKVHHVVDVLYVFSYCTSFRITCYIMEAHCVAHRATLRFANINAYENTMHKLLNAYIINRQ